MNKNINVIAVIVEILAALSIFGAVYIWAPVCGSLLTLSNGNMVAMKCAYSAKLFTGYAVCLLVIGLVALFARSGSRLIHLIALVLAVLLLLNTYSWGIGIGVCKMGMPCNVTALWVRIAAIGAGVFALIAMLFGKGSKNIPA